MKNQKFLEKTNSCGNPKATVQAPFIRITVLTDKLMRLEFSPTNQFEDRPSQIVWNRYLEKPDFVSEITGSALNLETEYVRLSCDVQSEISVLKSIEILVKETKAAWHLGDQNKLNLLGTARTLDNVSGRMKLDEGLISRYGWSVVDDTGSLVFNDRGWLEPRLDDIEYRDIYFFGHGLDFHEALKDFSLIAGKAPLVPRWALGNWWSRYWAYTATELLQLMDDFKGHQIPLSVCVVDMDWHITETNNESLGWTGYSWNRTLFQGPKQFLKEMHERGLRVALNLHPADGIYPHEDRYEEMCRALGKNPDQGEPIQFDISNPKFAKAYFECLHHPLEEEGVDFWWIDWQQGESSALNGLDPLWWLNHLHYQDLYRRKKELPLIFSRWGGLGNHRYPIGFSGDALVTWDSLSFQPFFTATAANVNYGWWSHDIGGHMGGVEDPELFTRWVQFGVFSPIFRLHSSKSPFHERRPWGYNSEVEKITSKYMRLRHKMIPYLYTMSYLNNREDVPLVRPVYYSCPKREEAYHCPDQYFFGSELLVAPYTSPADPDTRLSRQVIWLPDGQWFDFFNGSKYLGDAWYSLYGKLNETPVFACAGAIIPLADEQMNQGTKNPNSLEIHLFPLSDNEFTLFEDNGGRATSTMLITHFYKSQEWSVDVHPVKGEKDHLPPKRDIKFIFRGIRSDVSVIAKLNDKEVNVNIDHDPNKRGVQISNLSALPEDEISVVLKPKADGFGFDNGQRIDNFRKLICSFRLNTWVKEELSSREESLFNTPEILEEYKTALTESQYRALFEVITGVGGEVINHKQGDGKSLLIWNNYQNPEFRYTFSILDEYDKPRFRQSETPKFCVYKITDKYLRYFSESMRRKYYASVNDLVNQLIVLPAKSLDGLPEGSILLKLSDKGTEKIYLNFSEGKFSLDDESRVENPAIILASEDGFLEMVNDDVPGLELLRKGNFKISGNYDWLISIAPFLPFPMLNRYQMNTLRLKISYSDSLSINLVD